MLVVYSALWFVGCNWHVRKSKDHQSEEKRGHAKELGQVSELKISSVVIL